MGTRASVSSRALALSARRRMAIALLAAGAPVLAACGAGVDAQTSQVYQPAVGVNDRSGDVFVIHALVVTDGSGSGTVVASLINETTDADRLVNVQASTPSGAPLESADIGEGIALPAGQAVQLADEGAVRVSATAAGTAPAGEETEAGGVEAGGFVTLQFVFERASIVELTVPVVSNDSEHHNIYEDVPVGSTTVKP